MPETLAVLQCAYNVEEEFQDAVVENDASQPDDSNAVEMSQSTLRKDEASSDFSKLSITSQHHGNIGKNKRSSSGIDHWRGAPRPSKTREDSSQQRALRQEDDDVATRGQRSKNDETDDTISKVP